MTAKFGVGVTLIATLVVGIAVVAVGMKIGTMKVEQRFAQPSR